MKRNAASNRIARHANYSVDDYAYLREKGYDDGEILAIWDRDVAMGKPAAHHDNKPAFDIVAYLNA